MLGLSGIFICILHSPPFTIHRYTSTLSSNLPFFFESSFSNCLIYVKNKKLPTPHLFLLLRLLVPLPSRAPITLSNKMFNGIDATLRSHDLLWICLYNLNRSQFIFCALEWKQQAITIPKRQCKLWNVNSNMIRNFCCAHCELQQKQVVRSFALSQAQQIEIKNKTKLNNKKTLYKSIEIDLHSQTKWNSLSSIKYPSLFDLNLWMILNCKPYIITIHCVGCGWMSARACVRAYMAKAALWKLIHYENNNNSIIK